MPVAATNVTMVLAIVSVVVVVWLFCAFTVANFARSNGESYGGWLAAGLLGGPITLGVGYLYFRITGERYRRTRYGEKTRSDMPEMVKCPRCNESVPRSFTNCQFCGEPLHHRRRR